MKIYTDTLPKSGKLYNAMQDCEEFRKYCLRYGKIIKDIDTDVNGNFYRYYIVEIQGLLAEIDMKNGETIKHSLRVKR